MALGPSMDHGHRATDRNPSSLRTRQQQCGRGHRGRGQLRHSWLFRPCPHDDEPFVDGGLHSPDNADLVAEEGLDVVLVLSPLSIDSYQIRQSPLATILKAYPRRQLRRNVESLRRAGAHVLVLEPDQQMSKAMGLNAMATHRLPAVVEASEPFIDRWTNELDESRRRILQMLA